MINKRCTLKAKNKRPLPDTTIPKYQKTIFVAQKDPEQTRTVINILNKNLKLKLDTARNFREVTIGRLCTLIFQQRLNSILLDKKSSLLSAYIGTYNLTLNNEFYYIGALGSKKTHENRCKRLKEAGFSEKEINLIHGPIGIKLGGRSAPEIALSIIAQLVAETYKK